MDKVALNLASMPLLEKLGFAHRVHDALVANPGTFTDPPMDLDMFLDSIIQVEGDFTTLGEVQASMRMLRPSMADKENVVENNLRTLATYVQAVAAGSAATIELAGMNVRQLTTVRQLPVPAPKGF